MYINVILLKNKCKIIEKKKVILLKSVESKTRIQFFSLFQVLILEPSKFLQPAMVCVSEEIENRTVELKHVTPLKVCRLPSSHSSLPE